MSKRPAEVIAHIYVIYFKASLFPLTFAPGPQQDLDSVNFVCYNPGQNLLRQIAKMPIFSCHPGRN